MGNQVSSTIKIYSQNVSCDKISEKLIEKQGCEDMTFENRFKKILDGVLTIPHVDIIAFNEVSSMSATCITNTIKKVCYNKYSIY